MHKLERLAICNELNGLQHQTKQQYILRTEGSPFTIRNHPVKTQTFDFLYIFACNTSQMQFPCNIRLSLAYNHDKQILSGFL